MRSRAVFAGIMLICLSLLAVTTVSAATNTLEAASESNSIQDISQLPILFAENVGQIAPGAEFQATSTNATFEFFNDRVILYHTSGGQLSELTLNYQNANPAASIYGGNAYEARLNYISGNSAALWHTNLATYSSLWYQSLYEGIDLEYSGLHGSLKAAYHVAPNIDPAVIRWRFDGAASLWINDETGDLHVSLPNGDVLTDEAPIAWQVIDGTTVDIPVRFEIAADSSVGFVLGDYDDQHTLVIDPTLVYSSFYTSAEADGVQVAVDAQDYIYIVADVLKPYAESYFPIVNAIQPEHGAGQPGGYYCGERSAGIYPCEDLWVLKLTPDARTILFSTYIGGTANDIPTDMVVDSSGQIHITGITTSRNFPVANALYPESFEDTCLDKLCHSDGFVLKLSSDGSNLVFSTHIGGEVTDSPESITIDDAGNVYVSGYTYSTDYPMVDALYTFAGDFDLFLTSFTPDGSSINFSTYLGGTSAERYSDVAVNADGIFVGAMTSSSDFPVTPATAYQPTYLGTQLQPNGVLLHLNSDASQLLYGTYFGGLDADRITHIALGESGDVYVTGQAGGGFPTTAGAYDRTYGGNGRDAFVARFDTSQSGVDSLIFSTYIGGAGEVTPTDIHANADGSVLISGYVNAPNFPVVNGFSSGFGLRMFVSHLTPDGTALVSSSMFGSNDSDYARGMAVNSSGQVLLTGRTLSYSWDFPTTPNAFMRNGAHMFLAIVDPRFVNLDIAADNLTPLPEETVLLSISAENTTNQAISNLVVDFPIPDGLTFDGSGGAGSYNPSTGQITFATVAAGSTAVVNIAVTVDADTADTTITAAAAVVSHSSASPYVPMDSASLDLYVGSHDVQLTLAASETWPSENDVITLDYVVYNNSSTAASNVQVANQLPWGLQLMSFTAAAGTYESGLWAIGDLQPYETVQLSVVARVANYVAPATMTHTATVSLDGPDYNPANNTATLDFVIQEQCSPTGNLSRISQTYDGSIEQFGTWQYSMSGNGRYIAFVSSDSQLVPNDTNNGADIFVYDRMTCNITLETVSVSGQGHFGSIYRLDISSDGRWLVFSSTASNLTPNDDSAMYDVFLRDRWTGTTTHVTDYWSEQPFDGHGYDPKVSDDGRYVLFEYRTPDFPVSSYIYVRDMWLGTITLVSESLTGGFPNQPSFNPEISNDGRYITFQTSADDIVAGDTNGYRDVFEYDQLTGEIRIISRGIGGVLGNANSDEAAFSADGEYIMFRSNATNLTGYADYGNNVFIYSRRTGLITRASVAYGGGYPNSGVWGANLSADGRYVVFWAEASNLIQGGSQGGNIEQIFLRDTVTGTNYLLSVNSSGIEGNADSTGPIISASGQFIAFGTNSNNLTADDQNTVRDVFLTSPPIQIVAPRYLDLRVTQSLDGPWVYDDEVFTYHLHVTSGSDAATGVVLYDYLPDDVTFVSASSPDATCTHTDGVVRCELADVLGSQDVVVDVQVLPSVTSSTSLTNRVDVFAREADTDEWNNTSFFETLIYIQLTAPDALTASASGLTDVQLNWDDRNVEETAYRIERSPDGEGDWQEIGSVAANGTSYLDTDLDCGIAFHYRVRAYRAVDDYYSPYSNVVSQQTEELCAPQTFTHGMVYETALELTWSGEIIQTTDYTIEMSVHDADDWSEVGAVTADVTDLLVTGLTCDTSYDFRLQAYDSNRDLYSEYTYVLDLLSAPCAPTALTVGEVTGTSVALSWLDNSDSETLWIIERSRGGAAEWLPTIISSADVTTFTDESVTCGTTYDYRVRAARAEDNFFSQYSNTVTPTTVVCPIANLAVEMLASSDPVDLESEFAYTITVTNNGPEGAYNLVVTDEVPSDLTLVSVLPDTNCVYQDGVVTCTWDTLASGDSAVITLNVTADQQGNITNTASVTSDVEDDDLSDNEASVNVTVAFPEVSPDAPIDIITTGYGNPIYSWTGSAGAASYEIYVGTASGAQIAYLPIAQGDVCSGTACSVDLTTIAEAYRLSSGAYVWYIRTQVGGIWGDWVGPISFTLNAPPPGLVTPQSPVTGTQRPTFNWSLSGDAANATYFNLYLAAGDGSVPFNQWLTRISLCGSADSLTCSFTPAFDLIDGMAYTLYIASWGPGGQSVGGAYANGYVNVAQFTLDVPKPVIVAPIGTITDGYGNPTFEWTGVDGAATYEVYVGKNGTQFFYDSVTCTVANCSLDLTTLGEQYRLSDGSYQWYVRAQVETSWTPWAGPAAFTLDAAPPGLVTPGATTGTDTLRPTFNWSLGGDAANATYFNLYLAAGDGSVPFNQWLTRISLCGSADSTACSFTPAFDLQDGMNYTLYIASWGPGGHSAGGEFGNGYVNVSQFTVNIPKPLQVAPMGTLATGIGNPSYQWTGLAGATQYELYVGTPTAQIAYLPFNAGTVCAGLNCSVTLGELNASYLLPNGSYNWYVRALIGGVWGPWTGPMPFTVSVPAPGLITSGAVTGNNTLRPTFTWTMPAGAQNASYFGLYLVQDGGPVLFDQWLTRNSLCGSYLGTTCSFTPAFDLTNGLSYTLYIATYGPGGQSVGGPFGNGYVDVWQVTISLP